MNQPDSISDSNVNLDVGVKLQANLDPIVRATPQGLDKIFSLLFGKKYINAGRQAALSAAQNTADIQKILEGKATFNQESGALIELPERSEIRELVRAAIQEEEITNLISCTIHAAICIKDDQNSSESNVSTEFLNRWRNEAKFISEETAQAIWGKILSEEIQTPNSISIRTLDVIKRLTRKEAETFREACKFVIFGATLIDSTTAGIPIPQSSYDLLQDAGLIVDYTPGLYHTAPWMETTISFADGPVAAYYVQAGRLFIYVEKSQLEKAPSSCIWRLTKAGREMYSMIFHELEYDLAAISKALIEKKDGLENHLKYALYTDVAKNQIDFSTIRPVF